MNLIFTRSRQEQINISWEPCATSTPLKITSNKQKTVQGLPKHLLRQTEPVNLVENILKGLVTSNIAPGPSAEAKHSVAKRSKRSRLSVYFEASSSSDEEEKGENKRPVIRLNSKKKTKSYLTDKLESGEPEAVNDVNKNRSVDKKKRNLNKNCEKNVNSSVVSMKPKNIQALLGDNKLINVKQGYELENDCGSSDREEQILDVLEKNLIESTKSLLTNKENILHNTTKNKQSNFSKTSGGNFRRKDFKIVKESVYKKNNVLKSSQRATKKTNKITEEVTKKGGKCEIESLKNSQGKVNPELLIQVDQEKAVTPLKIWDNKTNLSHQLFSESREQEFINTLDLTSEEVNEGLQSIKSSLIQKSKNVVYSLNTALHPSVTNEGYDAQKAKEVKEKKERPKRTKQKPKEFWIPENSPDKPLKNGGENTKRQIKKSPKISPKNEELVLKSKSDSKCEVQNECFEEFKGSEPEKKVTKEKKKKIVKIKKVTNYDTLSKIKKVQIAKPNCVSSCSSPRKEVDKAGSNTESEKDFVEEEKRIVTSDKIVFRLLNNLTFMNNGSGGSAAECWKKNNCKCGVFKLKENSQLSWKTLHKNSHWNGIVIKGSLKMRVGEEELQLNEGDMTFVPPLTKWQATNIGKCESVFYYWCGRFDT